jgi:nucleotide-binding universal stress UspA family protein
VLIPLDGSRTAEAALNLLPTLRTLGNLKVRLLSVAESGSVAPVDEEHLRERLAADYLDEVATRFGSLVGEDAEFIRRTGVADVELIDEASRPDVDLLLMTTHGQSNRPTDQPGSVADRLIRGCSKPIVLLSPSASAPDRFMKIEVPLDGSIASTQALPLAGEIAARSGATLRLVTVVEQLVHNETDSTGNARGVGATLEAAALTALRESADAVANAGAVETALLSGHPAQALLVDFKSQGPDLVVMSAHGKRGFISWALGSTTERVIVASSVPVLLVRRDPALPLVAGLAEKLGALTRAG